MIEIPQNNLVASILRQWYEGMVTPRTWKIGGGRQILLGERSRVMGVLNATPDSFSDGGLPTDLEFRISRGLEQSKAGADVIDVGGESGITNRAAVSAQEEIARVVPVIEALASAGIVVSIDTYKPEVAKAALAAGALIVNDVSSLADLELARICAKFGAGLIVTHTRTTPKTSKSIDYRSGVMQDIVMFLRDRAKTAESLGVHPDSILLDPGPDLAKTPAQSYQAVSDLTPLRNLGYGILMATSRKDFLGAITAQSPSKRLPASLAALEHGLQQGVELFREHDVHAATEYLAVRAVLRGEVPVDPCWDTPEELRRDAPRG